PRAHDVLVALAKLLDERAELAKVVGQVGVAHQHVAAADERDSVDVGAPEPTSRRLDDPGAVLERHVGGPVARAVDDDDLTGDPGPLEALPAPFDEVTHRQLF